MAQGSHATLAGWEPKRCSWCGARVLVSKQSCGFLFDDITGETFAWHTDCGSSPKRGPELAAA